MQDTTVGAWVVMLHEQFMGWVRSNISYVYAWYVHAYLGIYQDMHVYTCISWYVPRYACMYMYILVCTCHIHVCTVFPNHVQVVRIPDDLRICRRPHSSFSDNDCGPPGAVGAWAPPPLPPGPQDLPRDSDYGPDGAAGGLSRSTPRRADDTTTRPQASGAGRRVTESLAVRCPGLGARLLATSDEARAGWYILFKLRHMPFASTRSACLTQASSGQPWADSGRPD